MSKIKCVKCDNKSIVLDISEPNNNGCNIKFKPCIKCGYIFNKKDMQNFFVKLNQTFNN